MQTKYYAEKLQNQETLGNAQLGFSIEKAIFLKKIGNKYLNAEITDNEVMISVILLTLPIKVKQEFLKEINIDPNHITGNFIKKSNDK